MAIEENFSTRELNQADKEWIESSLQILRTLINERSLNSIENYYDAILLDEFFIKCMIDFKAGKLDRDSIASAFGCGLGECLINQFGFKWVIFTDKYGTDLSLYQKENNIYAFPISSTHKRFDSVDAGTFDSIVRAYKANL